LLPVLILFFFIGSFSIFATISAFLASSSALSASSCALSASFCAVSISYFIFFFHILLPLISI